MGGSTTFPTAVDTFPTILPNTQEDAPGVEHDVVHENVHAAIRAIETRLGVTGSTDDTTVTGRLSHVIAGSFQFDQASALSSWVINHNLGRRPGVEVYTVGGVRMIAQVTHNSTNQVTVSFDSPTAGFALIT